MYSSVTERDISRSVVVSIVSHCQGQLVNDLLRDLIKCPEVGQIILVQNVPEPDIVVPEPLVQRVTIVRNRQPVGFGANHNASFRRCELPFFCVLNPDIRLPDNPFSFLLDCFGDRQIAVAAPAVRNPGGGLEDSARYYPTPLGLALKALGFSDGRYPSHRNGDVLLRPDWVAGMFLLLRSDRFAEVGGFDEGFYLYYEDIDLCTRFRKLGYDVVVCTRASAVHDPRRTSHRRLRYLAWHVRSILRYFRKHLGRFPTRHVT